MLPHSAAFHEALVRGAPVAVKAYVQRRGRTIFGPGGLFLSDVRIEFDELASSRRVLSARVLDVDGLLRPRFATDAFAPFGNELVIFGGLELASGVEYVQLGVFRLEVAEGTADGFVALTGYDRSYVIMLALDEEPHVIATGTTLYAAIADWISEKYPGMEIFADAQTAELTIDSTLVYEDGNASGDPWTNMRKLALLFGRELFIDWAGRAILRPVPTQTSGPYAAIYKPDEFNLAISATTRLSPGDLKNVIRIIGAGSNLDATIVSVAEVTDPADPLYAGPTGAFGRRPATLRSPAVTTQEQADTAAVATLATRKGAAENIALTLAPVLVHEPGDVVAFTSTRQDIHEILALSRWSLDVTLRQTMSIATRLLRAPDTDRVPVVFGGVSAAAAVGTAYDAVITHDRNAEAESLVSAGVAANATPSVRVFATSLTSVGNAPNAMGIFVFSQASSSAGAANAATSKVAPVSTFSLVEGLSAQPVGAVKASAAAASSAGSASNATVTTTTRFAEVMAQTPLIFLNFDETSGTNANDDTANNRDGTYQGGFTLAQTALIPSEIANSSRKSVLLDGSTGYISTSYNPFSGQKTFRGVCSKADSAAPYPLMGDSSSAILLRVSIDGTVGWWTDTSTVNVGWPSVWPGNNQAVEWVLEHDETAHEARLFINGVDQGLKTALVAFYAFPGSVWIGSRAFSADFWKGTYDAFDITDGLRSSGEISTVYHAGFG